MLDLLRKTWRLSLIPIFAAAVFLGAYFYFYGDSYNPPPTVNIPFEQIGMPSSSISSFTEVPSLQQGMLVFDATHGNRFTPDFPDTLELRLAFP